MSQKPIVEMVLFKLKPGINEEDFLAAADAIMPDLRAMSGYISRELLKDSQGQWIDSVHWHSLTEALTAAETFPTLPSARPFEEMIEVSSLTIFHSEQARQYSS